MAVVADMRRLFRSRPVLRWVFPGVAVLAVTVGSVIAVVAGSPPASPSAPIAAARSPSLTATATQIPTRAATPAPTRIRPTSTPTATLAPTPMPTTPQTPTPSALPSFVIPQDATLDAALARCPTRDEVALVDSLLTMTFEDDPTRPDLVCTDSGGSADLTYFQERAYQAVLSMRRIPFDASLPWTELTLFEWFAREVEGIVFRATPNSYCCDQPAVLVIKADLEPASLLFWDLWVDRDPNAAVGLMNLVDLLLHEARHVDGFLHTCSDGGDATLEEGGAWSVVYWYYIWLAEHATGPYMTPVDAPGDVYTTAAARQASATLEYAIGCPD